MTRKLQDQLAMLYVAAVEVEETAMLKVDEALASGDKLRLQIESDEFNRRSVIRARIAKLYLLITETRKEPKSAENTRSEARQA